SHRAGSSTDSYCHTHRWAGLLWRMRCIAAIMVSPPSCVVDARVRKSRLLTGGVVEGEEPGDGALGHDRAWLASGNGQAGVAGQGGQRFRDQHVCHRCAGTREGASTERYVGTALTRFRPAFRPKHVRVSPVVFVVVEEGGTGRADGGGLEGGGAGLVGG